MSNTEKNVVKLPTEMAVMLLWYLQNGEQQNKSDQCNQHNRSHKS